jgi:HEAT repeat protein
MMMEEEVTASDQELAPVKDILKTLIKTVKTFNVYPKDNPIYQKFAVELFEKFTSFFEFSDELAIGIEQYSLLYKGNEVYRSEDKSDNIAMPLFADGIRQITFQKGITSGEITDFIDILRMAPKSEVDDENDIVTLLWEKNIRNMGYTAVEDALGEDLVVEEGLMRDALDMDISEVPLIDPSLLARTSGDIFTSGSPGVTLTAVDLHALREELSGINETSLLSSAVELFLDLLLQEQIPEAFPAIMRHIGKILDIRVQRKDIPGAIEILKGLKMVSSIYNAPSQREAVDRIIAGAGSPERLRALFETSSDSREIRQYLILLGDRAVSEMIQVLGELQDRKSRRFLCEMLAETGKRNIATLACAVDDERWFLVRNIVMIMGMTKEPVAVRYLEKTLRHHDVRVRRETIRALDSIGAPGTGNLLLASLKDTDLTVRMAALKSLRRMKDPAAFDALRGQLSRDELKKKPFGEKKELFETAAVLGEEKAFPLLSELFRKGGLFEKDDITEIRACAAYGLGLLGTSEAAALLEQGKNSRKKILKEACIKALARS